MDREKPEGLPGASSDAPQRVRVWDAPTRIVHWALVALVATSWWTAENGVLQFHRYSGYALLGLLVFRVYWSFVGGASSRLFRYLQGPRALIAYAREAASRQRSAEVRGPGPNPLGAWSALALFGLLGAQIGFGLFAVDVDGVESGPLSHLVSFRVGRSLAPWHEAFFNILLVLIATHMKRSALLPSLQTRQSDRTHDHGRAARSCRRVARDGRRLLASHDGWHCACCGRDVGGRRRLLDLIRLLVALIAQFPGVRQLSTPDNAR